MNDKLIQLIYASSASDLMTEEELLALLEQSREKNARLNLTGILLYKSGNFLQVLEGPESAVTELYETIKKDERHANILTIATKEIKERDFGDWKMAFANLNKLDPASVPGYSEFLNDPFDGKYFAEKPSRAFAFLKVFKDGMR
ncbi:MAG: BLUF domain-containing protein [Anaerolineae bacterium]|nr:BLUF domain-containing protein [Anaerolineae bacterium]